MDSSTLVSIIIPTFNRRELLRECLNSISLQNYKDWECIIVDDGSNDGTIPFLKNLCIHEKRFKYYNRPDYFPKGASSCRNYGLIKSTGKYIQWLDDDDLLSNTKLELQVKKLEEINEDKYYTTCGWDLFWPKKNIQLKKLIFENETLDKQSFYDRLVKEQTFIPASAYLIPRSITFCAGFWNSSLNLNDDAEYFNRVLLCADRLVMTEGCHVLYREHSNERISTKKGEESLKSFLLSLQLMHAQLQKRNINASEFFKWKLMKVFRQYYQTYPEIIISHYHFFREHGIDLRFSRLIQLRIQLYKSLYPIYKKILKSKSS